jgi:hypothetical protein
MASPEEIDSMQHRARMIADEGHTPIRLAVINPQEEIIGYKIDTFWNLSSAEEGAYKVQGLEGTELGGVIMNNLLDALNGASEETIANTWISRAGERFTVSVQDVSPENFGNELARYQVAKKGDGYMASAA